MIDFSGLISSKPINNKISFKPNLDINNTDYKTIMEKALEHRKNLQQPKERRLSQNDDSSYNDVDISTYRDEDSKKNKGLKLGNEQRYPVYGTDTSREITVKDKETSEMGIDSKDIETEVKSLTDSILTMMAGLLNLEQQDIKEVRETLFNEINHLDNVKITEVDLIEKISTIIQNNELIGKAEIDKAIEMIKTLELDETFLADEQDYYSLLPANDKELKKPDKNEKWNNTKILDVAMKNSQAKTAKALEVDEANSHITEAKEEEIKDIETKLNNKSDLIEDAYTQNGLKVKLKDIEFVDTYDDLNNQINNMGTEYSAIDGKDFDVANTSESLQKSSTINKTEFINREELFGQILEISEVINDESISEIKIKLKPDSLGKLTIRLVMENGEITARFIAENQRVKETIESNFTELKDALNQKGINIQNLSVSIGNQGRWGYENQNLRAWNNSNKRNAYIGDVEGELEENIMVYDNPYNINEGYLDIRV